MFNRNIEESRRKLKEATFFNAKSCTGDVIRGNTYLTRWRPEDIGWSRPLLADGIATENAAELLVEDDTGVDAW